MDPTTSRFWHPFADLAAVRRSSLLIERGEGAVVYDDKGRSYIDASASLWYANIGHGRAEVADAVSAQLRTLAAYSAFGDYTNEPAEALAARIAPLAPLDDPLVFFTSGGSDSVDTAVKMARRYWNLRGQPERTVVLSRASSYHGMHGFGTGLGGISDNAAGYGSDTSVGFARVAANDVGDLAARIDEIGPERVAAFFAEPVIGAGGVIPPAADYLADARELCARHGILYVSDEVITGFGRMGTWFASEYYDIRPDLLLFAKGVTSGYIPLGGVIADRGVWQTFADPDNPVLFRHGYTYSAHAGACAAGLANLDVIEKEDLLARVRSLGPILASVMGELRHLPGVREVRHAGLLAAVDLDPLGDPAWIGRAWGQVREGGVLTRLLAGTALQVSPPFVITESQLQQIASVFADAISAHAPPRG
jgi:adenosylmethionine-8-amino-7-oxononanoate aminotransferase